MAIRDDSEPRVPAGWIDVSVPLSTGMVHWPSDPPFEMERVSDIKQGDHANVSRITMGSHTGTHVDAPRHFVLDGSAVSEMPLDVLVGAARVIEIKDRDSIKVDELYGHRIRTGERVLFKTWNSRNAWNTPRFVDEFVHLTKEAADYLSEIKIRAVGVDYLSVGAYKGDGSVVHQTLLKSGVWIVEGLNLSQIEPGNYDFVCLPLKILDGDGSPARAILRSLS